MNKRGGIIFHGYGSVSNPALHHLLKDHYLKRKPPMTDTFEWRKNNNVSAVLTFGVPASRELQISACKKKPELVIELNRLWIADKEPKNTASWFIAQCLKMMAPKIIVSYADTVQGHCGVVYRAANFFYAGWTDMERKTARLDYVQETITEDLFGERKRQNHGRHNKTDTSKRVRRRPKAKYWTVTGTKKEKAQLKEMCDWPILSWKKYPVPQEHMMINWRTVDESEIGA